MQNRAILLVIAGFSVAVAANIATRLYLGFSLSEAELFVLVSTFVLLSIDTILLLRFPNHSIGKYFLIFTLYSAVPGLLTDTYNHLWILVIPLISIFFVSTWRAIVLNVALFIVIIIYYQYQGYFHPQSPFFHFSTQLPTALAVLIIMSSIYFVYASRNTKMLEEMAWVDHLTGLPNMAATHRYLVQEFERGLIQRVPHYIVFLYVPHWQSERKQIQQDDFANELLAMVDIIRETYGEQIAFMGRVSDTKFLLVVHSDRLMDVRKNTVRVLRQLLRQHSGGEVLTDVKVSAAISDVSTHYTEADGFLETAFQVMDQLPRGKQICYDYYRLPIITKLVREVYIKRTLYKKDYADFYLVYQPQVDIASGNIIGVEVLTRWEDSELGPISPGEFIPIAEKYEYVHDLSLWIYEQALRDYGILREEGFTIPHISLNLSPPEFSRAHLKNRLINLADRHDIPPENLVLEITETSYFSNPVAARKTIQGLRAAGFRIAVDDFGSGYAGISYFREIPFDMLKLDRSLTVELEKEREREILPVFECVQLLADRKKIRVIVEGVETERELKLLQGIGFSAFQGYYFYRPMRLTELKEVLNRQRGGV